MNLAESNSLNLGRLALFYDRSDASSGAMPIRVRTVFGWERRLAS